MAGVRALGRVVRRLAAVAGTGRTCIVGSPGEKRVWRAARGCRQGVWAQGAAAVAGCGCLCSRPWLGVFVVGFGVVVAVKHGELAHTPAAHRGLDAGDVLGHVQRKSRGVCVTWPWVNSTKSGKREGYRVACGRVRVRAHSRGRRRRRERRAELPIVWRCGANRSRPALVRTY